MNGWRVSAIWREQGKRYRMVGSQCPECKRVHFPPREICPECTAAALLAIVDVGNQEAEPIAIELPVVMTVLAMAEQ